MSRTGDVQLRWLTSDPLYPRTVDGIQAKITEKGTRNLLSRVVQAKNDKETIATWKSDLNGILHTFNVCSVGSLLLSLTLTFQTELVVNTNAMVMEIHRNVVTGQAGTSGQHRSVSAAYCPSMTECSPSPRLNPGQLSQTPSSPQSYFYTVSLLANCLPSYRGHVSDATT